MKSVGSKRRRVEAALSALTEERAFSSGSPRDLPGRGGREPLETTCSPSTKHKSADKSKPWNRAAYEERLSTFMPSTWFNKPRSLMPNVCSQHGWINNSSDQLKCSMCNVYLCVVLPPVWDKEEYEEATERFRDRLVTAHRDYCVWKGSKAPDWFLGLPKRTHEEWLQDFKERFHSLAQLHDQVPVVHDDALSHLEGLDGEMIKNLLALVPHHELDADVTSCILAMCGWEARVMSGTLPHTLIVCCTCKRRVLLSSLLGMSDLVTNTSTPQQTSQSDPMDMVLGTDSSSLGKVCREKVIADNNVDRNEAGSSYVMTEKDVMWRNGEAGNVSIEEEGCETQGDKTGKGEERIVEDGRQEEARCVVEPDGREAVCVNQLVLESEKDGSSRELVIPEVEGLSKHEPQSLISSLFEVVRLPFDVISDHYPWCPWIEPPNIENISETRVLSISQPGWKALVDLLCHGDQWNRLPCQQKHGTTAGEAIQTARQLLQAFTH